MKKFTQDNKKNLHKNNIAGNMSHHARKVLVFAVMIFAFVGTCSQKLYAQIINTYVGNGVPGYLNAAPLSSEVNSVWGIGVAPTSDVYFADIYNNVIRLVPAGGGAVTTICGTGSAGFSPDGTPATAANINWPTGLVMYGTTIYFIDWGNALVRKIDPLGNIYTVAGTLGTPGHTGDGGLAVSAEISMDNGIAVDNSGNIYLAEQYTNYIRMISASGIISTIGGTGIGGWSPDGTLATAANIDDPQGIVVDAAGNVYFSELNNNDVRVIDAGTGKIRTVAGIYGAGSFGGDGGPATSANLNNPGGLVFDASGNLYISDATNQRVRMVNPAGTISTYAGNGTAGYSGDGGPAIAAEINEPGYLAVNSCGKLFIGDSRNYRMRVIGGTPLVITGPTLLCQGGTVTLNASIAGGSWSCTPASVGSIVPSGPGMANLTGISWGTIISTYTVKTRCGIDTALYYDTVVGACLNRLDVSHVQVLGLPGATVTYILTNGVGTPIGGGSATVGDIIDASTFPIGTVNICLSSVTFDGLTCPANCCVRNITPMPRFGNSQTGAASDYLSLTPNPNKGTFTLQGLLPNITTSQAASLEIVDMLGQVVLRDVVSIESGGINKTITLGDNIASGVYMVRIKSDDASQVIRFTLNR